MGACGATCGITRERARQREAARALALSARSAGACGAVVRAFGPEEVAQLAARLEAALPCQVRVLDDPSGAWWVYLVASMSEPTWVDVLGAVGAGPRSGSEETALRVGLSPLGRYATLQEVTLRGELQPDGVYIEEHRAVGVVDRRLQLFVKATQGLLRSLKIVTLDAAFLVEPLEPGGDDTVWTALFDPDPMGVTVASFVPAVPAG